MISGKSCCEEDLGKLEVNTQIGKVAIHTPCTLQHALQQPHLLAAILERAGFDIARTTERLLCCGSAGTYSILQSDISERLLSSTLRTFSIDQPALIATANIGCQLHLQSAARVPVVHWIELLDSPNTNHTQQAGTRIFSGLSIHCFATLSRSVRVSGRSRASTSVEWPSQNYPNSRCSEKSMVDLKFINCSGRP